MTDRPTADRPQEPERVVIRDKRRIDPVSGEARPVPPAEAGGENGAPAQPPAEAELLAERTADLQRLQAEYANYRKRTERDRLAAGEVATGRVLAELLPVLDDIERARSHGDLTGALKAVADQLDAILVKLGLEAFGAVGDPFDPVVHEAVMHDESDAVSVATCTTVLRPGYRHRDRLLRAAMVGVTDPVPAAGGLSAEPAAAAGPPDRDADPEDGETAADDRAANDG